MDLALLERTLAERGEPAYRARQVWEWTARGAASYDDMTTLPKALRAALAKSVPFSTLEVVTERESKDGTAKTLFRTADGHPVEAVLMRYRDGRRSLCLSSQSGCPLTCTFCATGAMRFGRNLTAWEILDQALHFRRLRAREPRRLHGHGRAVPEPRRGARVRAPPPRPRDHPPPHDDLHRRLDARADADSSTRSTSRSASRSRSMPPIRRKRSELMPVNDRYPLADVLAECRRYVELRRRKVFVEYVMLAGVNDSPGGRARARRPCSTVGVQGQPHPVQPDRAVRRLVARGDRALQGRARASTDSRDRAAHARPRHRSRVRAARLGALMERVTGIGGVFFRARDPQASPRGTRSISASRAQGDETYAIFPESRNTVWSAFPADTDYWPPAKQGMVNYTVRDLDAMLAQLRAAGVEVDEQGRASSTASAASAGPSTRRETASSSGSRLAN